MKTDLAWAVLVVLSFAPPGAIGGAQTVAGALYYALAGCAAAAVLTARWSRQRRARLHDATPDRFACYLG